MIICCQIFKIIGGIFIHPLELWWWIVGQRRACFIGRTCFSLFSRILLLFAHFFLHTFINFTFVVMIFMKSFILIVFIPALLLVWIYSDNINGDIWSTPFQLFNFCNSSLQYLKFLFVLWNLSLKAHGYFLDRIRCCAYAFLRWVADVLSELINIDIIVTCFHSFFVTWIQIPYYHMYLKSFHVCLLHCFMYVLHLCFPILPHS